jgi:hypothetical protein
MRAADFTSATPGEFGDREIAPMLLDERDHVDGSAMTASVATEYEPQPIVERASERHR